MDRPSTIVILEVSRSPTQFKAAMESFANHQVGPNGSSVLYTPTTTLVRGHAFAFVYLIPQLRQRHVITDVAFEHMVRLKLQELPKRLCIKVKRRMTIDVLSFWWRSKNACKHLWPCVYEIRRNSPRSNIAHVYTIYIYIYIWCVSQFWVAREVFTFPWTLHKQSHAYWYHYPHCWVSVGPDWSRWYVQRMSSTRRIMDLAS